MRLAWTRLALKYIPQHFLNFELSREFNRRGGEAEKIIELQRKRVVLFSGFSGSCKRTSSFLSWYAGVTADSTLVGSYQTGLDTSSTFSTHFSTSTLHLLLRIGLCGLLCPVTLTLESCANHCSVDWQSLSPTHSEILCLSIVSNALKMEHLFPPSKLGV